jgi:two-component system chemotaxis response regulator CheB
MKIRVLVIDDSALMRSLLTEMINSAPDVEVIGAAPDAVIAREMIKTLNPDVLTLDVHMPKMDGLEFLERLMRLRPMPVVMVSSSTAAGSETTLKALELGAVDFIGKPRADGNRRMEDYAEELLEKIRAAKCARLRRQPIAPPMTTSPSKTPKAPVMQSASTITRAGASGKIIFLGASTGGTEKVESGNVYIAPGHSHLQIRRGTGGYVTELLATPPVNRHRPSVDVLFDSAANLVGRQAVGVILTGMGKDGAQGLLRMRQAGAKTFGQDEASCVVYGMPREAFLIGAVEEQSALEEIGKRVLQSANR